MKKKAVVLFNLGGPDNLDSVKPFLFNLFYDKNIIKLPNPFRWILAKFISSLRNKKAISIYEQIGGKSPILDLTKDQAIALEKALKNKQDEFKVFIAMRYSSPRAQDVMEEIKIYNPDEVFLLPLYPQFSTTTSLSSIEEFYPLAEGYKLKTICCYPDQSKFLLAHIDLIQKAMGKLITDKFIILFSAHGLPQKLVDEGDPYQWQVKKTAQNIVTALDIPDLDWQICYQSKVGPMKWLEPDIEEEILKASKYKKEIILVPIAFVSDHSETLVELDIFYKKMAEDNGCPGFFRVESLGINKFFIDSLVDICDMLGSSKEGSIISSSKNRICPKTMKSCINNCE